MNSAFHIDPCSAPVGDDATPTPEFWGAGLALRIWFWLSQIYSHYASAAQSPLAARLLGSSFLRGAYSPFQLANQTARHCEEGHCESCGGVRAQHSPQDPPHNTEPPENLTPNRHRRRMAARRERGILPITRYTGDFLRPLLPRGLTRPQYIEALLRISPLGRLQGYDWNYYRHAFFRRGAMKTRAAIGHACAQIAALCHAPLCLD